MTHNSIFHINRFWHSFFRKGYFNGSCIAALILLSFNMVFSQNENLELKERTVQLALYKNADKSRTAVATVRQEGFKGRMLAGIDVKIKFYALEDSTIVFLEEGATGPDGKVKIMLPEPAPLDSAGNINISVMAEGDTAYTESEDQVIVKDCVLATKISEVDSAKYITTSVHQITQGQLRPAEDVEVSFYVKRLFGYMPIGEENLAYTDEDGIAQILFPDNIKGDDAGDVLIVARIEDDDSFGNVESRVAASWGIPITIDKHPFARSMWMPRAPLKLIVVFSIIFGAVWGIYFYILYSLGQIKKKSLVEKIEC